MNEPKTVRVRIAVAVNANGEWEAIGNNIALDVQTEYSVRRLMRGQGEPVIHWIEEDLPLPLAPVAVGANVTPAEEG